MMSFRHFAVPSLIFALAVVSGCGGSRNGRNTTTSSFAHIPINWVARSRALIGPASAASVKISLAPSVGDPIEYTSNRGGEAAEHLTDAVSPVAVAVGNYNLTASFFAGENGTGAVVATANTTVRIDKSGQVTNGDGTPFGNITNSSFLQYVRILPAQGIALGATEPLQLEAKNFQNEVVALPPGAESLQVLEGSSSVLVTGGQLKGLALGVASVQATVDGVESQAETVVVNRDGGPAFREVSVAVTGIAGTPGVNSVYATVNSGVPEHSGELVKVAPDGEVSTVVFLGDNPALPKLVPNAGLAFATTGLGTQVARIDLSTGAIQRYPLGIDENTHDALSARSLAISPADPNIFAVTTSNSPGIFRLYNAGTLAYSSYPNEVDDAQQIGFDESGTHLFGTSNGFIRAFRYTLDDTLRLTDRIWSSAVVDGPFTVSGNRLYGWGGTILETNGMARVAQVGENRGPIVVDAEAHRLWMVSSLGFVLTVSAYDTRTLARVGTATFPLSVEPGEVVRFGETGLAVRNDRTFGGGPSVVILPVVPGFSGITG